MTYCGLQPAAARRTRRRAGPAIACGLALLAWGCGGGGGGGAGGGAAGGGGMSGASDGPGPVVSVVEIAPQRINALTADVNSIHYLSPWFIDPGSARNPGAARPICYPTNSAGQAGGECYYRVGALTVTHRPDDLSFSNVRQGPTLPGGIPGLTADVSFTPSATDASDTPVPAVFPAAGAHYRFWGGWLDHGAFGVLSTDQGAGGDRVVAWAGLDFGLDRVRVNPGPSAEELAGGATEARWTGAMVGMTDAGDRVTGSMRLTLHFGPVLTGPGYPNDDTVSVSFHDVTGDRRIDSFDDLPLRDATFGGVEGTRTIQGGFVADPGSEEVLGHFRSNAVTGAFGGGRR